MRPDHEHRTVLALVAEGLNDCEISRRTGIPRPTVRGRRTGTQRVQARIQARPTTFDHAAVPPASYATRSCDQLGIEWRRMKATNIAVARRDSVAALDEFVGPKR